MISLARDEAIQAVYELHGFFRTIANAQPDEHLSQPHRVKTHTALSLLLSVVLVEEVRGRVNHIVQEPNRVTHRLAQIIPRDVAFAYELRQIDRAEVAYAKAGQRLLAARVCATEITRIVVPRVRHPVCAFDEKHARFSRSPCRLDDRIPDSAGLHRLVHDDSLARCLPFVEVAVPRLPIVGISVIGENQIPVCIRVHRVHELVADPDRDIRIGNLSHLALGGNELDHVGVPAVQYQHQGASPRSALLYQPGDERIERAP